MKPVCILTMLALAASRSHGQPDGVTEAEGIPTSSVVGWWPGDGHGYDLAGENHARVVNASFVNGKLGKAFCFDGVDDFVELPADTAIEDTRPKTVSFWANVETWRPWDRLFMWNLKGRHAVVALGQQLGSLGGTLKGNHDGRPIAEAGIRLNQWHHVCLVSDGKETSVFVDGQRYATKDVGENWLSDDKDVFLGARIGSSYHLKGAIDDLLVLNRTLDESGIRDLYCRGCGVGLIAPRQSGRVERPPRDSAWQSLSEGRSARVVAAMRELVAAGDDAAVLISRHMEVPKVRPERLEELIRQLDNDSFDVREYATRQLIALGAHCGPRLEAELDRCTLLEARVRIRRILRSIHSGLPSPEALGQLRAVLVLEVIASPASREALDTFAEAPYSPLTRQAAASALWRMALGE